MEPDEFLTRHTLDNSLSHPLFILLHGITNILVM